MSKITALADAGPVPWRPLGDVPLRHGYTLADANRLSMVAVRRAWGQQQAGGPDRLEVAWFAIIEHLYAADQTPTTVDLLKAATSAIFTQERLDRQCHGLANDGDGGIKPSFETYWRTTANNHGSHEDRIVDQLAVAQIWPLLLPRYQRVLTALAVHGNYQAAADAVGKSHKAFVIEISRARRAFLALWHEGETPSRLWAYDRHSTKPGGARGSVTNRTIKRRQRYRAKRIAETGIAAPRPRSKRTDLGITDAELIRRSTQGETVTQLAACVGKPMNTVKYRLQAEGVYKPRQRRNQSIDGAHRPY